MRKTLLAVIIAALLVAIFSFQADTTLASDKKIIVGAKNFTEQYVIGQMMKQLLEDRGFEVSLRSDLTSMALRAGMESGDIDLCAEYTGTAWMIHLKHAYEPGVSNYDMYENVKKLDAQNGFHWLQPIWNNNTYALASWDSFAKENKLKTISDLAALYNSKDGKIPTFVDFEFSARPDGLPALERFYDFKVARSALKTSAPGISLLGLKDHKAEVVMIFATDASLTKYDWYVFEDDKSYFPPYDLTPYIRQETLDKYPEVAKIILELVNTFPGKGGHADAASIAECRKIWGALNAQVDIEMEEPSDVARAYLVRRGLIKK